MRWIDALYGWRIVPTVETLGANVVLLDIWGPEKTFELIEKEGVTILLAVPARLAKIMTSDSSRAHLTFAN